MLAALVVGLYWCVGAIDPEAPQADRVALLVAGAALLAATLRGLPTALLTGTYATLIGLDERLGREVILGGSDVLRATNEALDVVLAGGNPYAHVMTTTVPPGSPLVYPPGEFLFYLPAKLLFGDITRVDTWTGAAIPVLLVLAGMRAGFAAVALPAMLYATWGTAAFHAIDGSNDVSASFVLVVALVLATFARPDARSGRFAFVASAVAFGWAIAFKQFALLVLPAMLRHLADADASASRALDRSVSFSWRRYAAIVATAAAVLTLPFLARDPGAFVAQQLAALTFHRDVWGINLAAALARFGDVSGLLPVFAVAELALTAIAVALSVRVPIRTLGAAALIGSGVVLVPLLLARWTTPPYYVYLGALAACGLALIDVRFRRIRLS